MATVTPHAVAAKQLQATAELIARQPDFVDCVKRLLAGELTSFDEIWGSSCALLAAALSASGRRLLVVVPDLKIQDDLYDDLESWGFSSGGSGPEAVRFPAIATIAGSGSWSIDQEYGDRIRLLKRLQAGNAPAILVASIQALLQPVPDPETLRNEARILRMGDRLDVAELVPWLEGHGFHRTTAVDLAGEFSLRGGILDLFAADWLQPVRIELFGDSIESIRQFDLASQRSSADVSQVELTVLDPQAVHTHPFSSYLAPGSIVLQWEPHAIQEQAHQYIERIPDPSRLLSPDALRKSLGGFPQATAERLATGRFDNHWRMQAESIDGFGGDIPELKAALDRIGAAAQVHVVARVEGELERIAEILSTTATAAAGRLHLSVGCVHHAYRLRREGICVIGCDQMFSRGELRRGKARRQGKAIDSFLSLRDGDLIVHLAHGIGRFRGLTMLDRDGQKSEHLELEFHGGTRIYVPATRIDLVQKYVGGTKLRPVLAKIGGQNWIKQKQAAEQAVTDLAGEMLELQAARAGRPGISCQPDTPWQLEFEHAFPWRETPDQMTAIQAIKQDMQTARPMDRLLCGDVGFGKTEVAMRAAFKAVENGYQVAVLVPTTILAEQHTRTFRERMSEFPLRIGKLSRFCSREEEKETLEGVARGSIDIVIGTHRLVSADVKFCNLGLAIVDEEQRFGVAHKERLKALRSSVDVLTMSATPIPRTLHMSLVGVRDISNLETPPEARTAVETKVTRFSNDLIRGAVLRELNRGGQVYFVHNRVQDIHLVRDRLQQIVPEASICVGHGQMDEEELERVMTEFIQGRYDILLATTIIESGLDIPNANTIFIDEADRYGLSDLHQLRGRVGRYKHQAYCYLLLSPERQITPNAAKRLQAIETFSEMGAGFAIAMRDLEIRGTGNLLGTEQSGHIAAVGYELYCHLLEAAVRRLQQLPARLATDMDIDLPVEAWLPDEYIGDGRQKIDLYRRLTRVETFDQIAAIREELQDRFGPLPPPAVRMLALAEVRLEAAVWQVERIFLEDKYLGFAFRDRDRFGQLAARRPGVVRIVDDHKAYVTLKSTAIEPGKMLALVKSILQLPT